MVSIRLFLVKTFHCVLFDFTGCLCLSVGGRGYFAGGGARSASSLNTRRSAMLATHGCFDGFFFEHKFWILESPSPPRLFVVANETQTRRYVEALGLVGAFTRRDMLQARRR